MSWHDNPAMLLDEVNAERAKLGLPALPSMNIDGTDGAGSWAHERARAEAEAARMKADLAEQYRRAKLRDPGRSLEERLDDDDSDYNKRTGR